MFDSASGREDYYKLIAQKIYRIRKEVEDRKKDRITGKDVCMCDLRYNSRQVQVQVPVAYL